MGAVVLCLIVRASLATLEEPTLRHQITRGGGESGETKRKVTGLKAEGSKKKKKNEGGKKKHYKQKRVKYSWNGTCKMYMTER